MVTLAICMAKQQAIRLTSKVDAHACKMQIMFLKDFKDKFCVFKDFEGEAIFSGISGRVGGLRI